MKASVIPTCVFILYTFTGLTAFVLTRVLFYYQSIINDIIIKPPIIKPAIKSSNHLSRLFMLLLS